MKVAFAGKGGVGKTTLAALFIKALAKDDQKILAIDCDPASSLGRMLGIADADKIIPIVEMKAMIDERMETSSDRSFYKLNPKVDDIPEKFAKVKGNVKLIVMGTVKGGGSGCMCPESGFVKALLTKILLEKDESIIMDMEAGLEHLGRATTASVNNLFIVAEPSLNSVDVAKKITRLASDLKIKNISVILNKVKNEEEVNFVKKNIDPLSIIAVVPFNESITKLERGVEIAIEKTDVYSAVLEIKNRIVKEAG